MWTAAGGPAWLFWDAWNAKRIQHEARAITPEQWKHLGHITNARRIAKEVDAMPPLKLREAIARAQ